MTTKAFLRLGGGAVVTDGVFGSFISHVTNPRVSCVLYIYVPYCRDQVYDVTKIINDKGCLPAGEEWVRLS